MWPVTGAALPLPYPFISPLGGTLIVEIKVHHKELTHHIRGKGRPFCVSHMDTTTGLSSVES
jgi:hypothetical protein